MNYKYLVIIEAIAIIALVAGVGILATAPGQQPITISGAGATFPAPLYQKWSAAYQNITGVKVNYQGIGSGGGITQFKAKSVDFGATDPPMGASDWAAGDLHIPTAIGGVVIVYHISGLLPNANAKLNFTGAVIAGIYEQNITHWNDAAITAINPGVTLPNTVIVPAHRSDSSGTTQVFTSFLSNESSDWKTHYGIGKVISWPSTGEVGGSGNPGVAAAVQQNDNSIGYVELTYALSNNINYGKVQNAAGKFIDPSLASLQAAANAWSFNLPAGNESWANVPSFFSLRATGVVPDDAYPITNPTYIIVYRDLSVISGMTLAKAKALAYFLWWGVHDGQNYCASLSYVKLPASVVQIDEATLEMMTFSGTPLITWS
jgi:phosphate transport system substrate-binding protein